MTQNRDNARVIAATLVKLVILGAWITAVFRWYPSVRAAMPADFDTSFVAFATGCYFTYVVMKAREFLREDAVKRTRRLQNPAQPVHE